MARRKRKETKLKQRRKRQFRLKQSVVLKNLSLRLKWPRRKEQIRPGPNPRQRSWPMILNQHLELLQLRSLHQYQELLVLRNILLFQELPALKRLQTRRQVLKPLCHWAYSRFLRRRCHRHQEHSAPTDWLSPSRVAIHPPMHQHVRRILSTMGPRPQDTKILHLHVLHPSSDTFTFEFSLNSVEFVHFDQTLVGIQVPLDFKATPLSTRPHSFWR